MFCFVFASMHDFSRHLILLGLDGELGNQSQKLRHGLDHRWTRVAPQVRSETSPCRHDVHHLQSKNVLLGKRTWWPFNVDGWMDGFYCTPWWPRRTQQKEQHVHEMMTQNIIWIFYIPFNDIILMCLQGTLFCRGWKLIWMNFNWERWGEWRTPTSNQKSSYDRRANDALREPYRGRTAKGLVANLCTAQLLQALQGEHRGGHLVVAAALLQSQRDGGQHVTCVLVRPATQTQSYDQLRRTSAIIGDYLEHAPETLALTLNGEYVFFCSLTPLKHSHTLQILGVIHTIEAYTLLHHFLLMIETHTQPDFLLACTTKKTLTRNRNTHTTGTQSHTKNETLTCAAEALSQCWIALTSTQQKHSHILLKHSHTTEKISHTNNWNTLLTLLLINDFFFFFLLIHDWNALRFTRTLSHIHTPLSFQYTVPYWNSHTLLKIWNTLNFFFLSHSLLNR